MRKVNSAREEFREEENPHPANPEKEAEWAAMLPMPPSRLSGHGRSPPTALPVDMTLKEAQSKTLIFTLGKTVNLFEKGPQGPGRP